MTAPVRIKGVAHTRPASKALGDDVTLSRFVKVHREHGPTPKRRQRALPGMDNPSIEAGRSLFFRKGTRPVDDKPVLVSGHNSAKIGRDVRKGALRGAWIYTLSLEERATCPRSCNHWTDCYGNGMPFAKRVDHRDHDALCAAIERDIAHYSRRGRPILVRLHVLGDFYSVAYVRFWAAMLALHPRMTIYGYTAWPPDSEIGREIANLKNVYGNRFAIRWSGFDGKWGALDVRDEARVPADAVICPEQTGKTKACATCGVCWATDKLVAFLDH